MKLVIPEKELKDFTKYRVRLVLGVNGSKPRRSRGKNSYKKQLNRIRRLFR